MISDADRQHQATVLRGLNVDYKNFTGEDMYLYMSEPGGGVRYNFHAGTVIGFDRAVAFMHSAIDRAREGQDHESIVYDGVSGVA